MNPTDIRVERAWQKSKDWATQFDGTPNEAYLADIAIDLFPKGVEKIAQTLKDLRVAVISAEEEAQSQNVRPETLQEYLAFFQKGVIGGLNINYTARVADFDLDLHIVVSLVRKRWVDLEIVWWADQAFPDDTDYHERFNAIARYFMELQDLFKAPHLYLGPESIDKPGSDLSTWIEI